MNPPVVSVIVPVYNAEKYLEQTLECICKQTLQNIEIILVDDGSTDSSLSILQSIKNKDPRIKIIEQKNQYAGVARNNGMRIAKGKYLSFLDADDQFEPHMYETMVNIAETEQSDIVFCNVDVFYEQTGQRESRSHFCNLLPLRKGTSPLHFCPLTDAGEQAFNLSSPAPWNKLFRASFVKKHNLSFAPHKSSNDLEFVLSAFAHAKTVSACTDVLIHYRISPNSISHTQKGRSPETSMRAYEGLKKRLIADKLWKNYRCAFNLRYCNSEAWHIKTLSRNTTLNHIINWRCKWEQVFNLLTPKNEWLRYNQTSSVFYHIFDPCVIFITKSEQQLKKLHDLGLTNTSFCVSFVHEGEESNISSTIIQSRAWTLGRIHCINKISDSLLYEMKQSLPDSIIINSAAPTHFLPIVKQRMAKIKQEILMTSLLGIFHIRSENCLKKIKMLRNLTKELALCIKTIEST